jgi:hypothetical protein
MGDHLLMAQKEKKKMMRMPMRRTVFVFFMKRLGCEKGYILIVSPSFNIRRCFTPIPRSSCLMVLKY